MDQIRGVWILSHFNSPVLTSTDNIKATLDLLESHGFNTLFIAVWNQGFTAFSSEVMESFGFPKQDPKYRDLGIDPLQKVIEEAKDRNLAIFPWFEYGFAASPKKDGGHILKIKPEWAALDQFGKKVEHGSLIWMNSLNKEVQEFMTALILEVIEKYEITGVQGCDRMPALPHLGGYDALTKAMYRSKFGSEAPSNTKDEQWIQFRADILTDYLSNLRNRVKAKDSNCVFSIAPSPYKFGLDNVLQDSDKWVKNNLVDFLCPQFYREDLEKYKKEVDRLKGTFTSEELKKYAPGISFVANGINLKHQDITESTKYSQENGLGGQVFWFFDGLLNNNNEMLTELNKNAGFSAKADFPIFS